MGYWRRRLIEKGNIMNKLVFGSKTYNLAMNGLIVTNTCFEANLVTEDIDDVENSVSSVDEITQLLADNTKVSVYKGYTKLVSINKLYDQIVDYVDESHEEVDEDTGETIVVAEKVPLRSNVLTVTLFQPTLEETVADQGEQITEIQEVLAELM